MPIEKNTWNAIAWGGFVAVLVVAMVLGGALFRDWRADIENRKAGYPLATCHFDFQCTKGLRCIAYSYPPGCLYDCPGPVMTLVDYGACRTECTPTSTCADGPCRFLDVDNQPVCDPW